MKTLVPASNSILQVNHVNECVSNLSLGAPTSSDAISLRSCCPGLSLTEINRIIHLSVDSHSPRNNHPGHYWLAAPIPDCASTARHHVRPQVNDVHMLKGSNPDQGPCMQGRIVFVGRGYWTLTLSLEVLLALGLLATQDIQWMGL